ncbi:MAG: hypothetical protein AAFP98_07330 [Pseudomonadota bacterium]
MLKRHLIRIAGLLAWATTVAAQTAGCGGIAPDAGHHSLDADGQVRTYRLHLPRNYDPATPASLILAFHGWGGDADSILDQRVVPVWFARRRTIIVAPQGLGTTEDRPASWTFPGSATGLDGDGVNQSVPGDTATICDPADLTDEVYPSCDGTAQNTCAWTQCQADDMAFVEDLLTSLEETLCLDLNRIYAAGASNGGMFVWGIGQNPALAPRFRAIASLIGLPHRGYLDGPGADADLPVLTITGTADATVPPGAWEDPSFTTSFDETEYYYTGATGITQAWAEGRGCNTQIPAQPVDVGARRFDCRSYCSADGDSTLPPVLDCRMDTGHNGHLRRTWPLIMTFFADQ